MTRIFCDMDGVLTNFDEEYTKATGLDSYHFQDNKKLKYKLVSNHPTFWENMRWKKDGWGLWQALNRLNNPVTILSAPSEFYSGFSKRGKHIWVNRELGKDQKRIFVHARQKCRFAGENRILIDDREQNIADWRAYGGIGILHKNTFSTIYKLNQYLPVVRKIVEHNIQFFTKYHIFDESLL